MRNFHDNGFAQNKENSNITYRFADGSTVVITETEYNAQIAGYAGFQTDKAPAPPDFETLKAVSDDIYEQEDRGWNAGTKKNMLYDMMDGDEYRYGVYDPSPEELYFDALDAPEKERNDYERSVLAERALDKLTESQRRRYILHAVDGLSTWRIAELEGKDQKTVYESLVAAKKKIKKFLENK